MEAHLAPKSLVQWNKTASSCEICIGPHDTQYCMENPKQAFVEYASSRTDEAGDSRLSKFEADFKQQQSEMTNKIGTFLKAINDQMMGALLSDTVKNPKLNVNSTSLVLSTHSYPLEDPQCSSHIHKSINAIKLCPKQTNEFQKDQPQVKKLAISKNDAPLNKGIKSPSKLLSPKYQSQSSLGQQNRNSSSPKRVHFINTITIINKQNEHGETGIVKLDTKDNDPDIIIIIEKENEELGEEKEEDPEYTNPPSPPDPSISLITKKFVSSIRSLNH
ncbi:hypothetical protein Tco_0021170 [Tanacetum coccineum]